MLRSFWGAWEAFAGATDYRGAMEAAIGNGGDTDTSAAIAGGLAGLQWGVGGIPRDWLVALRGQEILEPMLLRLLSALAVQQIAGLSGCRAPAQGAARTACRRSSAVVTVARALVLHDCTTA